MVVGFLLPLLVLVLVVVGVLTLVRRGQGRTPATSSQGADLIAYLLLAIAMGTAVFSLARLGEAAFPGGAFVFDPERQVATSLAGLVVAGPVAVYLWRRQTTRRTIYPGSPGWTLYLSLAEAVFTTFLVITLFAVFDWLFGEGQPPAFTDLLVYGGVFVFHELATRRTPPTSDAADLPRVIGSAIGLGPAAVGLSGLLHWLFQELYSTVAATVGGGIEPGTSLALLLAGLPVWWHRWLRPWLTEPSAPRNAWTFLVATAALGAMLGALAYTVAESLAFVLTDTGSAGPHFDFLPVVAALSIVAALVWMHHRRRLGRPRTDPVRAYQYLTTALALSATVAAATALVALVFERRDLVGPAGSETITAGSVLVVALLTWARFWARTEAAPREVEAASPPRRFYLLGLGVVMGLVGAGALIATLVFVFQRLLDVGGASETVTISLALFLFAGGAAWHLLRSYVRDRDLLAGSREVIAPFDVTVICSHPGMLATRFPKEARLRVLYRADDAGPVDDEMADRIVEQVANRSSLVWVEDGGFRVAPAQ